MADTTSINAVDFSILLRPECYIPFFSATALWTILYLFFFHVLIPKFVNPKFEHIRKRKKLQYKIANYCTSLLNGILLGYISLFWLYDIVDVTVTEQNCVYESTSTQRVWLMIANGYWAYDTIVFAILGEKKYSGKIDISYIFHHVLTVLLVLSCIISKYGANITMNVIWLHEWNNFLIIGAALRNYFNRNPKEFNSTAIRIVFTLKILYFTSFLVLRFGIIIPFGWNLITHRCPLYQQISVGLIWFLNVVFGIKSFLDLRKMYGAMRTSEESQAAQMTEDQKLSVYVSWKNLHFTVPDPKNKKQRKVILNDLNGHVKPGELVAVIGPSGSGKSSFLNCIAGRNVEGATGDILFNDSQRPANFARFTGYVLQDELYLESLTVMETFEFTAALKLPFSLSKSERMQRINDIIDELDLEKCKNTIIGTIGKGISGGERRRLAIGLEILNKPSLLLLDEPTTGLDSASALMVGKILKRLAETRHMTILCTVHQPRYSLASMFDKLYFLGKGHELYFGPSFSNPSCLKFFEDAGYKCPDQENPADFLLDLVNTHDEVVLSTEGANQLEVQLSESIRAKTNHPTLNSVVSSSVHLQNHSANVVAAASTGNRRDITVQLSTLNPVASKSDGAEDEEIEGTKLEDTGDFGGDSDSRTAVIMRLAKAYQASEFRERALECPVPEDERGDKIFDKGTNAFYVTPWYHQMWVITKRTFLDKWRDPAATISHVAYCFSAPVLPGLVFWQIDLTMQSMFDRIPAIAMTGSFMCFFRYDIIELFPAERAIFNREHTTGMYRPISFFVGRNIAELPLQFIFVWIMGTIAYWMYGLQNDAEKYLICMLIMESAVVAASGLLFIFSAFGQNRDSASVMATLCILCCILFDGNWVSLDKVPAYCKWFEYIDFLAYASRAVIANEYRGISFTGGSGNNDFGLCWDENGEIPGEDVLSLRGMGDINISHNIMMLWVLAFGYRAVAFLGVWLLYRPISTRQIIKNTFGMFR